MDRIYTNHRHGERRIHIEIDEEEVRALAAGDDTTAQELRNICNEMSRHWPVSDGTDA